MPFWLTPTLWVLATPFDIRVRYRGEVCAGTLARRTPPNWDGTFGLDTR